MHLRFSAVLWLLVIQSAFSQVGIGTVSPAANLDIPASSQASPTNKDGILVPRVDAFPATNPTSSQQGMLVFLTTSSGSNQPGFYYWNNPTISWIPLGNNSSHWSLTGNSGTSPTSNFMGTVDNQDLVFRRNNLRAGFIGNPDVAAGNKNTSFGANALNAATTGIRNTSIGTNTLPSNTTGQLNIAIGDQAMFSNTQGDENTAVGTGSLYSNITGNYNTAIGRNALTSSNSDSNTAMGYASLRSNTSGSFNTAVGRDALRTNAGGANNAAIGGNALYANVSGSANVAAGVQALRNTTSSNNVGLGYQSFFTNTTGTGNVGIGYQAGYNETASNRLYIENSNASATGALVYGEFDNDILRINGKLQIGNPAGTGYNFPVARGTNKQVLETDGSGNVSWANPNNSMSVMRANLTAGTYLLGTGGWQKIAFNSTAFDSNTEFSNVTGTFTAAKTGYYVVNAGLHTNSQTNNQYYSIGVYVNGTLYQETTANHFGTGPVVRTINCMVSLTAGQTVEIWVQNYQSGVYLDAFSGKTYFEVRQVK